MTPKEKAEELFNKFRNEYKWVETDYSIDLYRDAKQCALICVDKIINADPSNPAPDIYYELHSDRKDEAIKYWQSVKAEIEKL